MKNLTSISELPKALQWLKEKSGLWNPMVEQTHAHQQPFPFGLWFRGHSDKTFLLEPGAHRPQSNRFPDETNLYYHLLRRSGITQETTRPTFDWLSIMQHHSLPTRLLDWTGSLLIALFFVVRHDTNDRSDGCVWVLNARKLNHTAMGSYHMGADDQFSVVVRAEMARCRNLEDLLRLKSVQTMAEEDNISLNPSGKKAKEVFLASLAKPVAVYGRWLDHRMVFQQSVFTLSGGKHETDATTLPKPITLKEINQQQPLLHCFTIPKEYKIQLRQELEQIGIHEGTLFPEIDNQAAYVKRLWGA